MIVYIGSTHFDLISGCLRGGFEATTFGGKFRISSGLARAIGVCRAPSTYTFSAITPPSSATPFREPAFLRAPGRQSITRGLSGLLGLPGRLLRACRGLWTPSLEPLGALLASPGESFWQTLGGSWRALGRSGGAIDRSWGGLGRSWGALGRSWGALGRSWGHWPLLGCSRSALGTALGRSCGALGMPIRFKSMSFQLAMRSETFL